MTNSKIFIEHLIEVTGNMGTSNAPALKDLLAVLIIAIAIYEVATGKVSTRNGGVIWRKTHPVAYCINTGMAIVVVLFLLFVVVSDLSRAEFAEGVSNMFK